MMDSDKTWGEEDCLLMKAVMAKELETGTQSDLAKIKWSKVYTKAQLSAKYRHEKSSQAKELGRSLFLFCLFFPLLSAYICI